MNFLPFSPPYVGLAFFPFSSSVLELVAEEVPDPVLSESREEEDEGGGGFLGTRPPLVSTPTMLSPGMPPLPRAPPKRGTGDCVVGVLVSSSVLEVVEVEVEGEGGRFLGMGPPLVSTPIILSPGINFRP